MNAADLIAIFVRGISHESPAGGDEAGFQNLRALAGRPQTGRRDIGPDLRRAIQQGCVDLKAIAFGERGGLAGFNLWGEHRKSDYGGAEEHDDRHG